MCDFRVQPNAFRSFWIQFWIRLCAGIVSIEVSSYRILHIKFFLFFFISYFVDFSPNLAFWLCNLDWTTWRRRKVEKKKKKWIEKVFHLTFSISYNVRLNFFFILCFFFFVFLLLIILFPILIYFMYHCLILYSWERRCNHSIYEKSVCVCVCERQREQFFYRSLSKISGRNS